MTLELLQAAETNTSMKRLFDLFRRSGDKAEAAPRRPDFFCIYCNAKFPHDELDRVVAHLKPHKSKEEADARIGAAD
jgi:hypothetical protein